MSNVLYPLGLVQQLDIERVDRTLIDEFESGATTARAYWSAQNFKRKLTVTHAVLKASEYKYLKSFYSQRSGQFDSFFFRDNITRSGNALVRFASTLKEQRASQIVGVKIDLEEVAPIRALPEFDEITTAAGSAPALWYDANREYYLNHLGSVILDPLGQTHEVMGKYPATWQGGSTLNLGGINAQYQTYHFSGVEYARSSANVAALAGTQPACTIFLIAKHSSTSTPQALFAVGQRGGLLGIQLNAANKYAPWVDNADSYTNALQSNTTADTTRSLAVVWTGASNSVSLYTNAALIGTDTPTRAFAAGPAALGAALDGYGICNPGNAMTNNNVNHVLVFAAALTLAQIKAVHNLLAYQYGLALV